LVANYPVRFSILNGQVTGNTPLFDVADLQPQNLYYQINFYRSDGTWLMGGNYAVTGATFNLGAAIPTVVTTSNISYANPALLSANQTFTGNNTFTGNVTLNGPVNTVGPAGLIFTGNASDPAGANGDLNWNTTLNALRFYDGAWYTVPGTGQNNVWSAYQLFNAGFRVGTVSSVILTGVTGNSNLLQTGDSDVTTQPAGTIACFDGSGNITGDSCTTAIKAIQNVYTTSCSGSIGTSTANLCSISVTMPSAGCPCRVLTSYNLILDFSSSVEAVDFWNIDSPADNVWGQTEVANSNGPGGHTSATSGVISTDTGYANSAAVTFYVESSATATGATVLSSPTSGSGPGSQFVVVVIPSVN